VGEIPYLIRDLVDPRAGQVSGEQIHVDLIWGPNRNSSALQPTVYALHRLRHPEVNINPLKPELNPICYLLALLGVYHFLHVSRIKVKLLTFRLLMSYIYGAPILDVSRPHTTTQHSR